MVAAFLGLVLFIFAHAIWLTDMNRPPTDVAFLSIWIGLCFLTIFSQKRGVRLSTLIVLVISAFTANYLIIALVLNWPSLDAGDSYLGEMGSNLVYLTAIFIGSLWGHYSKSAASALEIPIIPIRHSRFENGLIAIKPTHLWEKASLILNGEKLLGKMGGYTVGDDNGKAAQFVLSRSLVDPIPTLKIDSEKIHFASGLHWYQYALILLPIGLVSFGGVLGGVFGALAMRTTAQLMRAEKLSAARYFYVLPIYLATVALYIASFIALAAWFPGLLR